MIGRIDEVVIDCAAPAAMAAFWAGVLGGQVSERDQSWAWVDPPAWNPLAFQKVPELKTVKNRVHFDVDVHDIAVATAAPRISGLAASAASWRTTPGCFRSCWIPRATSGAWSPLRRLPDPAHPIRC